MRIKNYIDFNKDKGFLYFVNRLEIDNQYIYSLINQYIQKYELENYIKKIIIDNTLNHRFLAIYNFKKKLIKVNLKQIILYVINLKGYTPPFNKWHYEVFYSELFAYIHHEIMHAVQCKDLVENPKSILAKITKISREVERNRPLYYKYHGLFPHEHHADAMASVIRNEFMFKNHLDITNRDNEIVKDGSQDETEMNRCNRIDASFLIENYKIKDDKTIVSPTEQFFEVLEKPDLLYSSDICNTENIFEKLIYGLPISKHLYDKINEVATGNKKIKNLHSFLLTL